MRLNWVFLIKAAAASVIFIMMTFTAFIVGPALETMYYPVVGPLMITRMESVDALHTRIWVQFHKYRECPPIDVYWYYGSRDSVFERVIFVVEKPLGANRYINRPVGRAALGAVDCGHTAE